MQKKNKLSRIALVSWMLFSLSIVVLIVSVFYVNSENEMKFPLDITQEVALENAKSNVDKVNTNERYCELWEENINYYYNEIIKHFEDNNESELLQKTIETQAKWEEDCAQQVDYHNSLLLSVYESGTIVPIKLSYFECEQYRQRAIVLYEQCLELNIDVDPPVQSRDVSETNP